MKTMTFEELLKDNKTYHVVYAKKGGMPKHLDIDDTDDLIKFINENLHIINLLSINNNFIDIDELIKKYSKL